MRLTEKRKGKNVIPLRYAIYGKDIPFWSIEYRNQTEKFLYGDAADKLAAYEDTGFEPEEIDFCLSGVISPQDAKERYEAHKKRYDEWFAWKQAEEQGRLVILPCKVNDTVFVITERGFIAKGEVRNFRFFDKLIVDVEYHHFGTCATSRYWGETVFLTREEAKATLKNSIEKES